MASHKKSLGYQKINPKAGVAMVLSVIYFMLFVIACFNYSSIPSRELAFCLMLLVAILNVGISISTVRSDHDERAYRLSCLMVICSAMAVVFMSLAGLHLFRRGHADDLEYLIPLALACLSLAGGSAAYDVARACRKRIREVKINQIK